MSVIEQLLFQVDDVFAVSDPHGVRFEAVRDSVVRHFAGNPDYRRYALGDGFTPELLRSPEDVDLVPLIPTSVFKRRALITTPTDGDVRECVSSGTQGGRSVVHRDRRTMERFLGSVERGADLLVDDTGDTDDLHLFVLGPDTDEAGDLWFAYVLSVVDLLYPATFAVTDGVLDLAATLRDIRRSPARPVVIGPPALVRDLALAARAEGGRPEVGERSGLVVTAGGWKRHTGESMSRTDFTRLVEEAFGLPPEGRVRDCFNMVELNTVIFECSAGVKHVPPWLRVTARNPSTLAPVGDDAVGLLAFVDPLPTSYPGFVLSDDFGTVRYDHACACGRTSDAFTVTRRLNSVESRGCALKMDGSIAR